VLNLAPNLAGKGGLVLVRNNGLLERAEQPGALGLIPNIDAIK
jgi:hypothetical protein